MADTLTVGQELESYILDTVRKSEVVAVEAINVLDRRSPARDGRPSRA